MNQEKSNLKIHLAFENISSKYYLNKRHCIRTYWPVKTKKALKKIDWKK
jgi:hypothetical protein